MLFVLLQLLQLLQLFHSSLSEMTFIPLNDIGICNNLEQSSTISSDGALTDCLSLCESMSISECNNVNYFTKLKHDSDSRCYVFNISNNCIPKSLPNTDGIYEEDQSFIYYKTLTETCIDYPSQWKDSTLDDCAAYTDYDWCSDGLVYLHLHSLSEFDYFRSNVYGTTAIQSCCNCDGGIYLVDTVYWAPYYSEDANITKDVICEPDSNLHIVQVAWDEYTAYQLCLKYNQLFLNSTLTQNTNYANALVAPCDIFIDINFESGLFNYFIQICDDDMFYSLLSFKVDWSAMQFYILLNSNLFSANSFLSNPYYTFSSAAGSCLDDNDALSYFGLMSCAVNPLPTKAPTNPTVISTTTTTQTPTLSPTRSPTDDAFRYCIMFATVYVLFIVCL